MSDIWSTATDDFSIWHDAASGRPMRFDDGQDDSTMNGMSDEREHVGYDEERVQEGNPSFNNPAQDAISISSSSVHSIGSQEVDRTPDASWERAAKELERQELVRLNNAKASNSSPRFQHQLAAPYPTLSVGGNQENSHADTSSHYRPSRQLHPSLVQLYSSSAEQNTTPTNTDLQRFRRPMKQPQKRQLPSSSDSGNQSVLTSRFRSNFTEDLSTQDAVASSSSISSFSSHDPKEKSTGHTSRISIPTVALQNVPKESELQSDVRTENVSRKPQNARVALKKNPWSNQSQLCFRPVISPPENPLHRPKALNQINRPFHPSMTPMPAIRPMQNYVQGPLQQNNKSTNIPMTPRPPRTHHDATYLNRPMMTQSSQMQYYNPALAQQSSIFHGQFVPNHIIEEELRARASIPPTPPDVKPTFYERAAISNGPEQENEVQHVDRRQALYPDVYEKNDDEENERMETGLDKFVPLSEDQWSTIRTSMEVRKNKKQKGKLMKRKSFSKSVVKRSAREIKEASQLPRTKALGAASKLRGGRVGRMSIGAKKIALRSDDSAPSEDLTGSGSSSRFMEKEKENRRNCSPFQMQEGVGCDDIADHSKSYDSNY